jgi:hypothetical protein
MERRTESGNCEGDRRERDRELKTRYMSVTSIWRTARFTSQTTSGTPVAATTTSRVCRRRQRRISCARNFAGASRLWLGLPREYDEWRVVGLRSVRLGSVQPVLRSALDFGLGIGGAESGFVL